MPVFYTEANGTPLGEYRADDENAALVSLARDAGYSSVLDAPGGMGDVIVAQVDTDELARAVAQATGRPVFQDAYGSGVCYFDGESVYSWDELALKIGARVWDFLA